MTVEIKAPQFPESVQDGTIATWYKKPGESVSRDELIVDIETDKVVLEVVSPTDGMLGEVKKEEGETVLSNEIIALVSEGKFSEGEKGKESSPEPAKGSDGSGGNGAAEPDNDDVIASPSARKLAAENNLDLSKVSGTGKGGRISKEDVQNALSAPPSTPAPKSESKTSTAAEPPPKISTTPKPSAKIDLSGGERVEKRVPMTRLRSRIAERLLEASQNTAMLTTFNEVDMSPVMALRSKYKDQFEKTHNGTRLGFMGFFVKACVEALKRYPVVNASIDGNDIVYHGYQDIGVAVSSDKGLVVPVLRNVENMGLADVEAGIRDFGVRAREGKLSIDEITGGTFTITNGGVFGSLMSTPILNPPQTAILGMHKIQDRPMAVNGELKILPMMYLALSYDHRLIDGKDAVQFLVAIKEMLEDPARILLEI